MKLIDSITADAKQNFTLIGENRQRIKFYLYYLPTQQSWFFDISYGKIDLNGAQLTVGPNILRNYSNNIDFGLAVTSTNGLDPFYLEDFSNGRIRLYLLNQAEVDIVEASFAT